MTCLAVGREDSPCTPKEQAGQFWDDKKGIDTRAIMAGICREKGKPMYRVEDFEKTFKDIRYVPLQGDYILASKDDLIAYLTGTNIRVDEQVMPGRDDVDGKGRKAVLIQPEKYVYINYNKNKGECYD